MAERGYCPPTEQRRCTAKSTRTGERCRKYALRGGTVCATHGGSARQVKRVAAARVIRAKAEAQATSRLGLKAFEPIEDPVGKLMELGGQAFSLVNVLREHVAELEKVGTAPGRWGETVKPEIAAYLSAIREAERILKSIVSLNLSERLVRLDEARAEMVTRVIEKVLAEHGLHTEAIDVRASVARNLSLVAAG